MMNTFAPAPLFIFAYVHVYIFLDGVLLLKKSSYLYDVRLSDWGRPNGSLMQREKLKVGCFPSNPDFAERISKLTRWWNFVLASDFLWFRSHHCCYYCCRFSDTSIFPSTFLQQTRIWSSTSLFVLLNWRNWKLTTINIFHRRSKIKYNYISTSLRSQFLG